MTIKTKVASAILFALAASMTFTAQANKTPAQAAAEYRTSSMNIVGYHMGPMAMMAKGKMDFDLETFASNAQAMATISTFAATGFAVAPDDSVEMSDSKPEIWENKEDFDAKNDDFVKAAAALADATKAGDKDEIMGKFKDMAKTCKACHKEYREKD